MAFSLGYAKNESFELIFGNVLIGLGGFILGISYSIPSLFWLSYPSFVIFGVGILFDVRVLRRFSYELTLVKNDINQAKNELNQAKLELKNEQKDIEHTILDLQKTRSELKNTKTELEQAERKMKAVEEKVFGHSMTFSKSSWANPLDRIVDELKKEIQEIKRRLDKKDRGW